MDKFTIKLRFTFHEIMDTDFTAVDVELLRSGKVIGAYRNYEPDQLRKEICANQAEEFALPSIGVARQFLESSGCYQKV